MRTFQSLLDMYFSLTSRLGSNLLQQQELLELYGIPRNGCGERVSSSGNSDPTFRFAAKLDDLRRKQKELETSIDCYRGDICKMLDNLDAHNNGRVVRSIIETKIFTRCSWGYVGYKVGYSTASTRRLYHEGIKFIDEREALKYGGEDIEI